MSFFVVSKGYLQIFPDRLCLRVPADSTVIEKTGNFSTLDRLVADAILAEALLREAIREAYASWADPRPILVIHPKVVPVSGLSEEDKQILLDLGHNAGARHCTLWQGDDLTAAELSAPPSRRR